MNPKTTSEPTVLVPVDKLAPPRMPAVGQVWERVARSRWFTVVHVTDTTVTLVRTSSPAVRAHILSIAWLLRNYVCVRDKPTFYVHRVIQVGATYAHVDNPEHTITVELLLGHQMRVTERVSADAKPQIKYITYAKARKFRITEPLDKQN